MCRNSCYTTLPERIDSIFLDIDSEVVATLPENDEQYAKLVAKKQEIISRFPNIGSCFEGKGGITLSAEEHAGLVEYFEISGNMENIERRAIYCAGHRDCFSCLKKVMVI